MTMLYKSKAQAAQESIAAFTTHHAIKAIGYGLPEEDRQALRLEFCKMVRAEEVRQLSWKQPYANLMIEANKIETRGWNSSYRGLVLIFASQKPYTRKQVEAISGADRIWQLGAFTGIHKTDLAPPYDLCGHAIAVGRLVESRRNEPDDYTFVLNHQGLYSHVYKDVVPIVPFEVKGQQGWKVLTSDDKDMIVPL